MTSSRTPSPHLQVRGLSRTPSSHLRARGLLRAAEGDTPLEGEAQQAERVTKVQLVERESPQLHDKLANQAAAIELLMATVSRGIVIFPLHDTDYH
jgi:hypothetical protein